MRATSSRSLLPMLALLASAAFAADPPEKVVREYMTALQTEGMAVAPRYIHPDELARFKEMLMPVVRREIANGKREFTNVLFGADTSLEGIEKVSGGEVMTSLMKLMGDELKDMQFKSVDILGSVPEGDVTHVIARVGVSGPKGMQMRLMEVISVKPYAGGWKLMLTGEIEGLAAALSAQ